MPAWRSCIGGLAAAAAWLAAACADCGLAGPAGNRLGLHPGACRPLCERARSPLAASVWPASAFGALRRLRRLGAMAARARAVFPRLGGGDCEIGLLPLPFFPPPQAILEVLIDDWARLGDSIVASLLSARRRHCARRQRSGFVTGRCDRLVARGRVLDTSRSCASSARCRRRLGCRLLSSSFRRATAPACS